MKEFYLYTDSNKEKFYEFCDLIEKTFPKLKKQKMLIDFDSSLVQPYKSTDKKVTVINDVEDGFIYARADFDLSKYIKTLN